MNNLLTQKQLEAIKERWRKRYAMCLDPSDTALEDIRRLVEHIESLQSPDKVPTAVLPGDERIKFMNAYRDYLRECAEASEIAEPFDAFVRRMIEVEA